MYDSPHRRLNPLTGEWVLVSPQRAKRPWQGEVNKIPPQNLPAYSPDCYLCPGNTRSGGIRNPQYEGPFVFVNDFSALLPDPVSVIDQEHELFQALPESGVCKVVCFSERHDLTIPELSLDDVENVIRVWSEETEKLFRKPGVVYVQIFENKGALMGCSNPHPHSQIWSQARIPNEPEKELKQQREYYEAHGRPLLLDYLEEEMKRRERIIAGNEHFTALVPFWAIWPFEVLVIAHRPVTRLPDLSQPERRALADIYRQVTIRYDNLFKISFPYSMGIHQAPNAGLSHPEWVLHAHFYPPLLRSASVKKFMVGYELLGMPQRDITAESAASRLRELPAVHYTRGEG